MHIAAANPSYISRDEVPQDVIESEKGIFRVQIKDRPQHVIEKIVEGKLDNVTQIRALLTRYLSRVLERRRRLKTSFLTILHD